MRKTIGIKGLHASKKEDKYAAVPPWLIVMYNSKFFSACIAHPDKKKNELDRFCIDCLSSCCSHCVPAHTRHKHVKIRRYIYSDVINRQDLCKLFNCSGIQSYHTNKAKVLFLKQRSRHHHHHNQQHCNSRAYTCIICDRSLQDNSHYCSIACKVLDIYGNRNREENTDGIEDRSVKDEKEEYLTIPFPRRQKLRQSRKGVPQRAPMF
ncbi:PLATZ domain-containing protein [Cephalotus follicularis]|uniref:PLATZ domain-containing protein n=1 Tax=Cephalotus follicularis TaxID=3775 RepID=A0A1Q3BPK2_CEPFO|nr:PLATZ domain-containing protein [Cephalotus follicularis]